MARGACSRRRRRDLLGEELGAEPGVATVLAVEGVRCLRVLLEATSRGSEGRGTRRRAGLARTPHSRQRVVEVEPCER